MRAVRWSTISLLAALSCCKTSDEPASTSAAGSITGAVETASPPPPVTQQSIRIATWNILNLRDDTPVELRAEVIAQYDIVALQEIESLVGLERLRVELEKKTGQPWKVVHSDLVGEGNSAEYYAFIFRGNVIDDVGWDGQYKEEQPDDFSREPYFAGFRAGNFDFALITIHTDPSPQSVTTKEVRSLAKVWQYVRDRCGHEQDILLMGDFNKDKPTNAAFDDLEKLGTTFLITEKGTFTSYSNKPTRIGANWYDNIWADLRYTGYELLGSHGVDYLHERYFQQVAHPHLQVRKEISDHCPVWAEFDITKDDDDGE